MASRPLSIEIHTGKPLLDPHGRWATLRVGGVDVFSELVYDTDRNKRRTVEQAESNLLRTLVSRLNRLLEEE